MAEARHGDRVDPELVNLLVSFRDAAADFVAAVNTFLETNRPPEVEAARVAELFPGDLRATLTFEGTADATVIRPKHFLGAAEFAKILDIVKTWSGRYVSAGKRSYFEIPRKA